VFVGVVKADAGVHTGNVVVIPGVAVAAGQQRIVNRVKGLEAQRRDIFANGQGQTGVASVELQKRLDDACLVEKFRGRAFGQIHRAAVGLNETPLVLEAECDGVQPLVLCVKEGVVAVGDRAERPADFANGAGGGDVAVNGKNSV